jgi:hypothetical protein
MAKDFEISKTDRETKAGMIIQIEAQGEKMYANLVEIAEGGERQPARRSFLRVIGSGDSAFMAISAPLREVDEGGQYIMRARQKDGKFLDAKGKEVDSEDKAALEYVYKVQKDDASKIVYGQVATLNVKNTKTDGTPTQFTMVSVKLFTDAEALQAERVVFKLKDLEKGSEAHTKLTNELNEIRKKTGTYDNYFINKGFEALREMGFTVREKPQKESSPSPE